MSQPILVAIIVLALVAAAYLVVRQHKGALSNLSTDLKAHVSAVSAGAETRLVRLITRPPATPAKPLPVVATTSEPAPAAPAASETVAPPPATVAPAAPPAAPAPSAGGGGTVELDIWPQVIEPSNGGKCVPPQPLRSPAGYPLFYAIGAGNAPVGPARVLYNGNTFPDDAAVASYIATVAAAHAADDVAAAAAAAQVFAGPVPVSALTKADLEFLWWANANPATPKLHNWAYTVLSGSRRDIQVALASVSADIAWLGHYDATKYQGVLRPYYDAAVKA